ncbi:MAG: ribosome assembly cofactor RimP [Treponema sp.]|nr:ribosome assembly cofactor RimP [Treponema sp.]
MQYTPKGADPLSDFILPIINGMDMSLVDMMVSRHKGSVQVRLIVYKPGSLGVNECSKVHHAVLPRLELQFPGQDLYVEVSSPGIDRNIKDASEFVHYLGRGIKCYRTDISDWSAGILESADDKSLVLKKGDNHMNLSYEIIAKAKLDYLQEVES